MIPTVDMHSRFFPVHIGTPPVVIIVAAYRRGNWCHFQCGTYVITVLRHFFSSKSSRRTQDPLDNHSLSGDIRSQVFHSFMVKESPCMSMVFFVFSRAFQIYAYRNLNLSSFIQPLSNNFFIIW